MQHEYWIVRRVFCTGLGFLFLNAFTIFYLQGIGLFGAKGILPISEYVSTLILNYGGTFKAFWEIPTLFIFFNNDLSLHFIGLFGIFLSLPLIFGYANFFLLFLLWIFHMSVIHAGQIFYSFGWETQLLELTFLSFFMFPFWNLKLNQKESPPHFISLFFMRWMMFRLMLGAGLIKIRGDECWRDLTCTYYHYETQPNPHFLSPWFHFLPDSIHKIEVGFNHFVEIIVPFFIFAPRKLRLISAGLFTLFQIILILSGNLAWLNWITLVMVIPLLDDQFFKSILNYLPRLKLFFSKYFDILPHPKSKLTQVTLGIFAVSGFILSIEPAQNLLSEEQKMNSSFNKFHLINSYGAFGSVSKNRFEIIISGTNDEKLTSQTQWQEYDFKCKPGDIYQTPCWITPYHLRLDWQIWFSAMRPEISEVWLIRFAQRLLENEKTVTSLIKKNPFEKKAPTYIKMDLYRYRWNYLSTKNWWTREFVKTYMPPAQLR